MATIDHHWCHGHDGSMDQWIEARNSAVKRCEDVGILTNNSCIFQRFPPLEVTNGPTISTISAISAGSNRPRFPWKAMTLRDQLQL